jgi:hypothetical protein
VEVYILMRKACESSLEHVSRQQEHLKLLGDFHGDFLYTKGLLICKQIRESAYPWDYWCEIEKCLYEARIAEKEDHVIRKFESFALFYTPSAV